MGKRKEREGEREEKEQGIQRETRGRNDIYVPEMLDQDM